MPAETNSHLYELMHCCIDHKCELPFDLYPKSKVRQIHATNQADKLRNPNADVLRSKQRSFE